MITNTKLIQKVEGYLVNNHGAKCETFVTAIVTPTKINYDLDRIKVTFPNGRRWDIVEIKEGELDETCT